MPDRNMSFLDPLSIIRRNNQRKIRKAFQFSASFPRKRDHPDSFFLCGFDGRENIGRISECFHFPGKCRLISLVITERRNNRRIRRKRDRGKRAAFAFRIKIPDKLSGNMLGISRGSPISDQEHFPTVSKTIKNHTRSIRDRIRKLLRGSEFYICALSQLTDDCIFHFLYYVSLRKKISRALVAFWRSDVKHRAIRHKPSGNARSSRKRKHVLFKGKFFRIRKKSLYAFFHDIYPGIYVTRRRRALFFPECDKTRFAVERNSAAVFSFASRKRYCQNRSGHSTALKKRRKIKPDERIAVCDKRTRSADERKRFFHCASGSQRLALLPKIITYI